ncbi:MAG: sensor histidine kinase [Planctomycetaceae bacterium]
MLALPLLLPHTTPRYLEAAVDALLLSLVAIPVLWLTMVFPLKQAARQRDLFLSNMFLAIEDERRRVAHDLHDGVGQTLTMLVSGLKGITVSSDPTVTSEREVRLTELAQRALDETKRLARGLRPSLLDDLGLAAAIERVACEVEENQHLSLNTALGSITRERLPEKVETALFRIFQECLANIVQHSGATEVSIQVVKDSGKVTLSIRDNGRGFDSAKAAQHAQGGEHLGLIGMQERTALLGGRFELKSSSGSGTTVTVTIPV